MCKELMDAILGMKNDVVRDHKNDPKKFQPMYIRRHLCTNVLEVNERLFRVIRAVLLRAVPGCPKLPDVATLKRELGEVKSVVKSRMDFILKKLVHASNGGDGGGGGRSSPSVKWQVAWDGLFDEVWPEALAACDWYVCLHSLSSSFLSLSLSLSLSL